MKTSSQRRLLCAASLLFCLPLFSQTNDITLRFSAEKSGLSEEKCFFIEVKSENDQEMNLLSQSYRFYYNASVMRFLRDKTTSLLDEKGYSSLKVIQAVHDSDASGYGNLEFSNHLGFVNFTINDLGDARMLQSVAGVGWVQVARTCFEISNLEAPVEIIWARKGLTDGYATAFTGIALMKNERSVEASILYLDIQTDEPGGVEKMVISNGND